MLMITVTVSSPTEVFINRKGIFSDKKTTAKMAWINFLKNVLHCLFLQIKALPQLGIVSDLFSGQERIFVPDVF